MDPSQRRVCWIVVGLGLLLALVLVLRNPIRKYYKHHFVTREPSKGLFQNCEGLAVDSEGNMYVGSQDWGRLTMLDRSGKEITHFDTVEGYTDGEGRPAHITRGLNIWAIAPRHLVLVAVHNVAEIEIGADNKPRLVRTIGSRGSGPGQMDGPEGLWRDTNGDLYVTDEHNRRINVFDKEGKFLRSWPVPQDPQTVMVWKDRVYVALDKRNTIACYSKDGVEKFRIGLEATYPMILYVGLPLAAAALLLGAALKKPRAGLAAALVVGALVSAACIGDFFYHKSPGQFRLPDYMRLSPDEKSLYVTDRANGRIQVFDPDGRFKFAFGRKGAAPGHLLDPKDLAFDLDGNLIVADSDNDRLQVFTPDGKPLRAIQ